MTKSSISGLIGTKGMDFDTRTFILVATIMMHEIAVVIIMMHEVAVVIILTCVVGCVIVKGESQSFVLSFSDYVPHGLQKKIRCKTKCNRIQQLRNGATL